MAAQARCPRIVALGVPQALKSFSMVTTQLGWTTVGEVHFPIKWESLPSKGSNTILNIVDNYFNKVPGPPAKVISVLILRHFPFASRLVKEMEENICAVVRILAENTDRVAVICNVPDEREDEDRGYRELDEALRTTTLLGVSVKERCAFLTPKLEPTTERPFLRVRNTAGHLLESVPHHYLRSVLKSAEFAEFTLKTLTPVTPQRGSRKRKFSEGEGSARPGRSHSERRNDRMAPPSRKRGKGHAKPREYDSRKPNSVLVDNRVTQSRLQEALKDLRETRKTVADLQITVGELKGENKILRKLLPSKLSQQINSSSSSSSGDSDAVEPPQDSAIQPEPLEEGETPPNDPETPDPEAETSRRNWD